MDLLIKICVVVLSVGLILSEEPRGFDASVQHLFELYTSNQRLLEGTRQRDFRIIYPQQLRRNQLTGISTREHRIRHHGTHEHYKHVTFQIEINNVRYKLKLDLNDALLASGLKVKHYIDRNQQVISKTIEHCYYQGVVKKDDWSAVAVSTCNGIRGVIQLYNETYIIQPLMGGDEGMRHPHVLYKATVSDSETCGNSKGQWKAFKDLHRGEYVRRLKYLKSQRLSRDSSGDDGLDSEADPIFLRLALVLDTSVYQSLNLSHTEMVTYTIQTANILDMYYKELGVRVSLVYAELWNIVDQFSVSTGLRQTLNNFLRFTADNLGDLDHDVAHFITSRPFEEHSIGLAVPDSVCTDRAIGVNRNPDPVEPQQVATVLAHMIGHNLGLKHDEDGECECDDVFGCIMSYRVLQFRGFHSRRFSACSAQDLEVSVQMGLASCLIRRNEYNFGQQCGNGYVERGEECDCGSREECTKLDPCCDPDTCLLRAWASCREGPCCKNCTLLSSSHICRDKTTECDVPEFCTGVSGQCPENNFLQDGAPCSNQTGFCYGGICPTLTQQCRAIWGRDASSADSQCFERFNPTGNFNGHCGRDEGTAHFIKCAPENSPCGLLHCAGGNKVPLYGPDKAFSKTTVFSNGVEYQCKIVHGPAALDMPHTGMVQDGTRCGDASLCLDQRCVPVASLTPLRCPANSLGAQCSHHGICTRAGTCFCYPGWGGFACDVVVPIITDPPTTKPPTTTTTPRAATAPPSGHLTATTKAAVVTGDVKAISPSPSAAILKVDDGDGLSTTWLVIILASVVAALVLVIGLIMVCYRRKPPNKAMSGSKNNIFTGQDSSLLKKKNADGKKSIRLRKKKKGLTSEDESDIGELPPPPIIVTSPNSAKPPERGILKNSMNASKYRDTLVQTSEDTQTDDNNDAELGSRSSLSLTQCMGNDAEPEDDEDAELRQILEGTAACYHRDLDHNYAGDPLSRSDSLEQFVLPAPSAMFDSPLHSPALSFASSGRNGSYSFSRRGSNNSGVASPARAKHLRLRPLEDTYERCQGHTYVDLSPSPDEMMGEGSKLSPCASDDIRNSETEADRDYYQSNKYSDSTTSPKFSYTNSLGRDGKRPYRETQPQTTDAAGLGLNRIPKLSPLRFEKFLLHGRSTYDGRLRGTDDEHGLNTSDLSSHHGTGNRSGCEKSSGYGSEQDPDRKSIEDLVRSRSQSKSPPTFSNVIRTGPNRIQLVPSSDRDHHQMAPLPPPRNPPRVTYSANERLQKLLEGLPRINAGSYERSPLPYPPQTPPSGSASSCSGSSRSSVIGCPSEHSPSVKSRPLPAARNRDSGPCIDRSLEEIPRGQGDTESESNSSHTDSPPHTRHSPVPLDDQPSHLYSNPLSQLGHYAGLSHLHTDE